MYLDFTQNFEAFCEVNFLKIWIFPKSDFILMHLQCPPALQKCVLGFEVAQNLDFGDLPVAGFADGSR